ncbi:phosphopantothenate/pantothenate synthetase [Methanoplanus sp. FWC-SCC4]|uniref:4-phosphopantoate--beta-alanine ligase n=1 Tax=Methanochimaera problematica TaxID=2609417 RepID=A0AA97I4G4_9EURY|nr:4-phosphopantoate--beta-alanine ligase [Methanoplanus sp. FWC-SCC4]WOF16321.1 phosphopantothenate/pantothenate synthetase [Methanoplanus sp. FWC-SCC4]
MIPKDHPRYASLVKREKIAESAWDGVVAMEGVGSHGRGEAFDYLIGEKTIESALLAEKTAAALFLDASFPVISVNGNTAVLAAAEIAELQKATGAVVEVNLFHRTEERIVKITKILEDAGVSVLSGRAEKLLDLSHDRALCLREGIYKSDVILVPLEDGDRCEALVNMGKKVITIDLNPLSRTAQTATLTITDELTRALPNITAACRDLGDEEQKLLIENLNNKEILKGAIEAIQENLSNAMD